MTKKPTTSKDAADKVVKNIRRKTCQTYSSEVKIRIVLAGLRGEESIAVLCRREGIAESLYYSWSKEFLEAGIGVYSIDKKCFFYSFSVLTALVLVNSSLFAGYLSSSVLLAQMNELKSVACIE